MLGGAVVEVAGCGGRHVATFVSGGRGVDCSATPSPPVIPLGMYLVPFFSVRGLDFGLGLGFGGSRLVVAAGSGGADSCGELGGLAIGVGGGLSFGALRICSCFTIS